MHQYHCRAWAGLIWTWLALLGLWMLLVDSTDFREALAGAIAATLGTVAFRLAVGHAAGGIARELARARLWRLPLDAVRDGAVVLAATVAAGLRLRPVSGRFESVPFPVGGPATEDAARRAVALATRSFTPNTCVLGFDAERGAMVLHRMVRRRRG